MQAPITTSAITQTPGGLTSTTTAARTAVLSDPLDPLDPLSLTSQTDTVTVNGKTARNVYTAATREHLYTSPQNRSSTLRTDVLGRPTFAQILNIAAVTYGYDARGRLISLTQGTGATARSMAYAYGADGFVERITDAQNRETLYQRDLVGRITQSTLPGNRLLQMSYDANSNVTGITPPAKPSHSFNYTPVDLAEQYTPPTVTGIAAPATHYAYNRDKQITRLTRPDGQTIDFAYDTGGRLSSLTPLAPVGSASAEQITYGYAATTGQLTSITTPTTTLGYAYDGFLLKNDAVSGTVSGTLTRTYNTDFNVTGLAVNGSSIGFAYDNDNLLTQAGAMTLTRNTQNGFLTGSTLGNTSTTQTYNAFGEMNRFTANQSASTLFDVQYAHDTLGRITTKTETLAGQTDVYAYGYDLAGRLISVSKNGITQENYTYDANGNRTQGNGTTATHDDQDRLLTYGGNTYTYTANGELQTKTVPPVGPASAGQPGQATAYTYDLFGNLRRAILPDATQIDYLIDGRNRRIGKTINGTRVQGFLYQDQLRIAAELDGSNNVVSRFVYGTKINVPEYLVKSGVIYRIITDHLGSVRLVVNTSTGEITQRMDYDSFGHVIADTNPGFQPFGFAGGLYDQHTKLTRFGARDYDAETGRWVAKDLIGFAGGDSNLYAYTANNPVNWIDPSGHEPSDVAIPGERGPTYTGNDGVRDTYDQNICVLCPGGEQVVIAPPGGDEFEADDILERPTNEAGRTIEEEIERLVNSWPDEESFTKNYCP